VKGVDWITSYEEVPRYDDYTYDFPVQGGMYSSSGIGYHNTFHTGGAVSGGGGVTGNFKRLEELFKVPKTLKGKAILSEETGTVQRILDHLTGGKEVVINAHPHLVPVGAELLVSVGSRVSKGDKLTEGTIKPQELAELKNFRAAQVDMLRELNEIYENKFQKKTFETVLRGISDNAEVVDPGSSNLLPGDRIQASRINKMNHSLSTPVKYNQYFKSIDMGADDSDDWVDRITNVHLKAAIQDMAATSMSSHIHSNKAMPAYMYGLEFGQSKEKTQY
jgi:hypothetical protein